MDEGHLKPPVGTVYHGKGPCRAEFIGQGGLGWTVTIPDHFRVSAGDQLDAMTRSMEINHGYQLGRQSLSPFLKDCRKLLVNQLLVRYAGQQPIDMPVDALIQRIDDELSRTWIAEDQGER
jgi:hypothetical protein